MRQSTKDKLFLSAPRTNDGQARFSEKWYVETDVGNISGLWIPRSQKFIIVHEFHEEADGFQVYAPPEENNLEASQRLIGLID